MHVKVLAEQSGQRCQLLRDYNEPETSCDSEGEEMHGKLYSGDNASMCPNGSRQSFRLLVQGQYLAGFIPVTDSPSHNCGLQRLDHAVGNVHNLIEALDYVSGFTGFHE